MMANYRNELPDDTCWVYARQDDEGLYTIAITYDEGFCQKEASAGLPVLLWRKFENTLIAAGYRIALKGLSESLLEAIKRHNEKNRK